MALAAESCQWAPTIRQEDNLLTGVEWLKEGITSIFHQARNGSSPSAPTRRYRLVDVETGREVNHSNLRAPTIVYRLEADEKDGPTAPTLFGSSTLAELAVFEKTKRIQSVSLSLYSFVIFICHLTDGVYMCIRVSKTLSVSTSPSRHSSLTPALSSFTLTPTTPRRRPCFSAHA